jgi:predicted dehydrogenase
VSTPRILVIGAGSIGSRHARNLVAAGATVDVMDPATERASAIVGAGARAIDLGSIAGYDGIVIASPTSQHAEQLRATLRTDARVMIEKPFALAGEDLDALVALAGDRVMVGYNLRLHEPLERVAQLLSSGAIGEVLTGRLWFGSWLPDWRPTVDYRTTYSAQRALGGGVLFDAIHELDEAIWFFGDDLEVHSAFVGRVGPLEIDVEDTVKALLVADGDVPIELSLDYLSRRYRRGVELVGSEATLRYDWSTCTLVRESGDHQDVEVINTPVDHAYVREADRFLQFVNEGTAPPVDAATGAASVRLAARILEVGKWT